MSTFLKDAKTFYSDFFSRGTWSEIGANNILSGKEDINKRKECLREVYRLILDNEAISDEVKDWIKTNHSIQKTAVIRGITVSRLKNQIYYVNTTLGNDLSYKDNNIIHIMIMTEKIESKDWENINKIVQAVIIKKRQSLYKKENIFSTKNLLINIPRKEYCTSISDESFNTFLRLIMPYFINERKRVQQRINEQYLKEAGYFNYLLTPGINLSSLDKSRLARVKKLLDDETVSTYNKLNRDKMLDLTKVEEEEKKKETLDIEEYRKKSKEELKSGEPIVLKSRHVQFDF
ncbi:MAG: hypothetical protein HDR05_12380 [Lachnospiraceae bacterium]|nr:hypothetical protein [Lachnospiraceae bacterium]